MEHVHNQRKVEKVMKRTHTIITAAAIVLLLLAGLGTYLFSLHTSVARAAANDYTCKLTDNGQGAGFNPAFMQPVWRCSTVASLDGSHDCLYVRTNPGSSMAPSIACDQFNSKVPLFIVCQTTGTPQAYPATARLNAVWDELIFSIVTTNGRTEPIYGFVADAYLSTPKDGTAQGVIRDCKDLQAGYGQYPVQIPLKVA